MPYSTLFQIVHEVKNFSARNQSLVSLFDYINQVIVNHLLLLWFSFYLCVACGESNPSDGDSKACKQLYG